MAGCIEGFERSGEGLPLSALPIDTAVAGVINEQHTTKRQGSINDQRLSFIRASKPPFKLELFSRDP